jgi:hypothetical protein
MFRNIHQALIKDIFFDDEDFGGRHPLDDFFNHGPRNGFGHPNGNFNNQPVSSRNINFSRDFDNPNHNFYGRNYADNFNHEFQNNNHNRNHNHDDVKANFDHSRYRHDQHNHFNGNQNSGSYNDRPIKFSDNKIYDV